jgi:enoyl-CoA hydratase/carnithine racemase
MTDPALIIDRPCDGVVVATLNRPKSRNAVSFEMWEAFSTLLDEIERNTPIRALIITGSGDYFSFGGDQKIPPSRGEGALAPAARLEWGQRIINRLRRLPVPVIAAVEGGAYGIGWSIVLACDLIFAADNAKFGAPFVNFGLTPDGGSAWFLNLQIGRYKTADLILSARSMDVDEAFQIGLVSRVFPAKTVLHEATLFAANIGQGNRHAVELTKRLLQAADGELEASHALELAYCARLQDGDEVKRAREAFMARATAKSSEKN